MNFIANESKQKLRGGFYTEPDIAAFLTRWVLGKKPKAILEPSCGDGVFIEAVLAQRCASVQKIFACETDAEEAKKARERASAANRVSVEVHTGDFLKWFLYQSQDRGHFDGILGNPPFIRYQYLAEDQQYLAGAVFDRLGLGFTKHTNAWVPFVLASLSLLTPGGRLGMVIPSEVFHIPHAQSLRRFLAAHCSRMLIIDPEELWFNDALQGVVLLLAEKKEAASQRGLGLAVREIRCREVLGEDPNVYFESSDYVNGESIEGKWMSVFLSKKERTLLAGMREDPRFARFLELADVDVGIVTGANKFFLVTGEVVKSYGLEPWAHPMFGRSEHVAGVIYDKASHNRNRRAGLPTNFLWFDAMDPRAFPNSVQRYLRTGEQQELPKRFKCRVRSPWYKVPSVYASPVAMLKRAHHFPRLVLNKANAFTTDTAYRIKPRQVRAESLVYSFLNSLTCLCAELEGRHYGGGVLELVPSEIERLLLPLYSATPADLQQLDKEFRNSSDAGRILRQQDGVVLDTVGVSASDRIVLHEAWDRLRNRRQRNSAATGESHDISMKNGELLPRGGAYSENI
jgi:adenine-specific DNA methylase